MVAHKRKPPRPVRRGGLHGTHPPKTVKTKGCLWTGPDQDGITFSLLSKFHVCRERFRLKVVEGVEEDAGFDHPMEFGSLWHEGLEAHDGGKDYRVGLRAYRDKLRARYPADEKDILHWFNVAVVTFPRYVTRWRKDPEERKRVPIMEEVAFRVPYKLPSGRTVILRGKFDCVFRIGKTGNIWLQENKTKGFIDADGIQATLPGNLQTMLYQTALREAWTGNGFRFTGWDGEGFIETGPAKFGGVLYNVVRRPLSDRHAIRPRKTQGEMGRHGQPTKKFYGRLGKEIAADPDHYFKRWKVRIAKANMDEFKKRTFNPMLETLLLWWDSIEGNPFDPWTTTWDGEHETAEPFPNPHHFQTPWGIFNSMFGGFRGDLFEYLTTNRTSSVRRVDELFPELK